MGTTNNQKTARRRPGGRLRPACDRLEARLALSGSTLGAAVAVPPTPTPTLAPSLSIVAVSPSPSNVLATSPTQLVVSLDRPVDNFSLANGDFKLVHVAADGTDRPLSVAEARLAESLDPADPSGSRILLTLSKPLVDGRYRLLLEPGEQLQALDGTALAAPSSESTLTDFTLAPNQPQSGLASAVDLGTIGPAVATRAGSLDLADDPGAVRYYKLVVAPGHEWRLGLEVSALQQGSPLASTLSLFDAGGRLIATDSQGFPGNSGDPYLFAGIAPGTYYVGVSARKNIPGASGAYDPSRAVLSVSAQGGPFQLHVVADPADRPTEVLGIRVDRADPLSSSPTGLTLQFSGPIDAALIQGGKAGLTLVDQDGVGWPVTPLSYDVADAQLSVAFDGTPAPGSYTIRASGLIDLAGNAPVASGLPAGTLAAFSVAPVVPTPGDLGAFLPGLAKSGLKATIGVDPTRPTIEQFVVVEAGVYALEGEQATNGVNYSVQDARGDVLSAGPWAQAAGPVDLSLPAGVYRIVFNASGSLGSEVGLTIRSKDTLLSSFLEGGVAQGPALGLRLVTPSSNFGQATAGSTATTPSAPPATAQPSPSGSAGLAGRDPSADPGLAKGPATTLGQVTPSGPSVVGLVYGAGPVGRPSSPSDPIGVVGPGGPSGLAAIASAADGLPSGLIVPPVMIDGDDLGPEPDVEPARPPGKDGAKAPTPRGLTLESGLLARSSGSRREDDRILADADWIGQLVERAVGWMEDGSDPAPAPGIAVGSPVDAPVVATAAEEGPSEGSRLEVASIGSPVGIGVALATLAYRCRRRFLGRAGDSRQAAPKPANRPALSGPHRRPRSLVR